jgi:error-prone DNA polymerase
VDAPRVPRTYALPSTTLGEHVVEDYAAIGLSLKAHPMAILRPIFAREHVKSAADIEIGRASCRERV